MKSVSSSRPCRRPVGAMVLSRGAAIVLIGLPLCIVMVALSGLWAPVGAPGADSPAVTCAYAVSLGDYLLCRGAGARPLSESRREQ
jgi:hypothetical protein